MRAGAVRRLAWYPILLVLVFLAYPYTRWLIAPADSARVVAAGVAIALGLTIVATAVLDRDHGAFVAALGLMALASASTLPRVEAFALAVVVVVVEYALGRSGLLHVRVPWARVTELLTVALGVLLVFQVASAVQLRLAVRTIATSPLWNSRVSDPRPDIYVLLADGHGRADVLEHDYGMDMSDLRASLASLGLIESPRSHANQIGTVYTLSVLLNGRPFAELGQDLGQPVDPGITPAAIRDNSVFRLLRGSGYRIVALDSGYADPRLDSADEVVDVGPRNELERTVMAETAIGNAIDRGRDANHLEQGERTLREIDRLEGLASEASADPRLVFVHLPSPHVPYVLDGACRVVAMVPGEEDAVSDGILPPRDARVDAERAQTSCVDRLLVRAVGRIVHSEPDAVVILLSDHGPGEFFLPGPPTEPGAGIRAANLFWARVPGHGSPFPDDVSTVNVFPILFNTLWNTGLPLHPNDIYFGPLKDDGRFVLYRPSR